MKARLNRILLEHTVGKFTRPITWFSVLLRMCTCSRYSHVSIDYTNEQGERRVLEAVWPRVHDIPYEEWFIHSHRKVLPKTVNESLYNLDLEAARKLINKRYGVRDLAEVALHVVRTYWFSFGNKWNGKSGENSIYCSELGGVLLGLANSHIILPGHYEFMGGLQSGEEFETGKELVLEMDDMKEELCTV